MVASQQIHPIVNTRALKKHQPATVGRLKISARINQPIYVLIKAAPAPGLKVMTV